MHIYIHTHICIYVCLPTLLIEASEAGGGVAAVEYGGNGPWMVGPRQPPWDAERKLALRGASALQCVYPHPPRFGIEACALYNGAGSYDDHEGIAMAAQLCVLGLEGRCTK